jgi:hypothetical protein
MLFFPREPTMISLTFYGGAGEIGGDKILLDTLFARCFIII